MPPLLNPNQTFLSRVLIPYSGQQVLIYARQKSSFIAIISYLAVSKVALGFPQALRTCCCLSTAMWTMHQHAGQGHLHQHPTQGLDWALVWLCCCSLSLLLVFSSLSKLEIYFHKEPGGSSQPHPQCCICWQEGYQNICSLSPSQQLTYFCFQAMFVLSWPRVPHSFFLPAVRSRFLTCHFSLL